MPEYKLAVLLVVVIIYQLGEFLRHALMLIFFLSPITHSRSKVARARRTSSTKCELQLCVCVLPGENKRLVCARQHVRMR